MGGVKSKLVRCCACCGYRKKKEFVLPSSDISDSHETKELLVEGIDFCIKKNGDDHHTKRFDLMTRKTDQCLVVRRGQSFDLDISITRPFNIKSDKLYFILKVADESIHSDKTAVKIPLSKEGTEAQNRWIAVYKSETDSNITVAVTSPSDCVVAKWTLQIIVMPNEGVRTSSAYTNHLPIYILFNPWCKNDSVYMPDACHRSEFVENDEGIVYQGNSNDIFPHPWYYAQYDKDILDCAMYLMENIAKIKGRARGEPVKTIRALSAAINVNDNDNGVLVGNWQRDAKYYADGTQPSLWMGSLEILQKYYKTKKPVKYAQCWVFAGVLTTVCRALGIPCRPVTCFNSAHDQNKNLTIEVLIDEDGKEIQLDSVWNYHVWNEVWMARPELGAAYGGWQIADATPQETSDRLFQCGPAPLAAVYNGDTQLPYDVPFVFAEVNADMVKWKYTGSGHHKQLVSVDTTTVGRNISTKAIGSWEREDLTDRYKSPENTNRERETLVKALLKSHSEYAQLQYYRNVKFTDVVFQFEMSKNVVIGQDFEVVLHMKNQSSTNCHHVTGNVNVNTETYRGRDGEAVKRRTFDVELKPEQKTEVTLLVSFDDYYEKLIEQASFKIACVAKIGDVDYVDVAKFRLRNPDIKIEFDGLETLTLEMENSLPVALNNGRFYVHGTEEEEAREITVNKVIQPGHKVKKILKFVPPKPGRYNVATVFVSDELKIGYSYYTFDV